MTDATLVALHDDAHSSLEPRRTSCRARWKIAPAVPGRPCACASTEAVSSPIRTTPPSKLTPWTVAVTVVTAPFALSRRARAATLLDVTPKFGSDLPVVVTVDPPPNAEAVTVCTTSAQPTATPGAVECCADPPKSTHETCGNGHVTFAFCMSAPVFAWSRLSAIAD